MRGTLPATGCARAASGHTAAAPPSSVMNSRRCSGRDAIFIAPPAQNRTGGFPAYGFYGAFFVKGASRHFCRALLLHSFVRSAASILPSRPHMAVAVARSGGHGRRFFSAAEGLSLTEAARDRVVGRAMIRGEPAIGREQSREPRLYSVEPTWGLDHEAVIRFCGQGSEAAGPFSQRHCSHSRIRIAATSDRHRLPGSSNAVRCRTLFVLSRSRVLPTRVLLTPPAATRHRPAPHRS